MTKFSLKARWVLPIDREPMPATVVTIDDGVIVAVGDRLRCNGANPRPRRCGTTSRFGQRPHTSGILSVALSARSAGHAVARVDSACDC